MRTKWTPLLFLIILGCNTSTSDMLEIDPSKFKNNKITLADIADDISYILLDNSYPLSYIYSIKKINNTIYLSSQNNGIITFDKTGKFLRKIGNIGKGPNEYLYYKSFAVDNQNETIYVLDNKKKRIVIYTSFGNYIRSISLMKYGGYLSDIEFINSRLIVSESILRGRANNNWIVLDTLGNQIKTKENSIPYFNCDYDLKGGMYRFKNEVYYWNCYNDTIFSISANLNYKISKLFSPGEHRLPRYNTDDIVEYVRPWRLFETNKFIVFIYGYKNEGEIALIDKKNKKSFLSEWKGDNSSGILNHLDGGPSFTPISYFEENGQSYMIGFIYAYLLRRYLTSTEFKNSTPKYPEKKKELEQLANSLDENDNLVLMLVKLKE